jgi:tetratricopeptide (TPR) repeat protein
MSEAETLVEQGIAALQAGNKAEAKRLFTQALNNDTYNDKAWYWLAHTLDDPKKQLEYLDGALKINPQNADALALKEKILSASQASAARQQRHTVTPISPRHRAVANLQATINYPKTGLGKRLASFPPNRKRFFLPMFIGTSVLLLVICGVFVAPLSTLWVLPGLLLVFFGLRLVIEGLGALNREIVVYEHGLQVVSRLQPRTWRWDEFDGITIDEQAGSLFGGKYQRYDYRLYVSGTQVLRVTHNVEYIRALSDLLVEYAAAAITRQMVEQYNRGQTIYFPRHISVNQQGIASSENFYSWNDIREIRVFQGNLELYREINPYYPVQIYTQRMKNALPLFNLVDSILNQYIFSADEN